MLWHTDYGYEITLITQKEKYMEARERIAMKGVPRSVFAKGNVVEIWCASPTGDSSDSVIFQLQCVNNAQAETIAEAWRNPFGLPTL